MKKLLILFLFLTLFLLVGCSNSVKSISQNIREQELLASFPNTGFYYYYDPNFDINTFKKPIEVTPAETDYFIYIYDNPYNKEKFLKDFETPIEDNGGFLFSMLKVGIENKPHYFIHRTIDDNNMVEMSICEFKPNDWQVKYMLNPETDKFVKQVIFNNGELNIASICNPSYVPFHDI